METGGAPLRLQVRGANPVRGGTTLAYALPRSGRVGLAVFDVNGRRVARLVDGIQNAGLHELLWNARDDHAARIAAGIYFVRLETDAGVKAQKIIVAE